MTSPRMSAVIWGLVSANECPRERSEGGTDDVGQASMNEGSRCIMTSCPASTPREMRPAMMIA